MSSNESVFDRLYRQSTAASRAASIQSSAVSAHVLSKPSSSNHASHRQKPKISRSEKSVNSPLSRDNTGNSDDTIKRKHVAVAPRNYTGSWRITSTSKYDTRSNKTVTHLDPGSLKLSAELKSFDEGEIDASQFARYLIAALFDRDHMKGRHWDYDPPSASPLASGDDNIISFQAEKEATWDWKDIYSVATAKGTISFYKDKNEIRVEDYSYYAAG